MMSNPFYAGYVTGNLVDGKLIKGHHPVLIDLKTFMKANEILAKANNVNVAKKFHHEQLPLKIFARDEVTGDKLSGCKTKGNWYYKTKSSRIPLNIKAHILNDLFSKKLIEFEYNKSEKKDLAQLISHEIKNRLTKNSTDTKMIKKQITEKQFELDKIESKYLRDEISRELFEKHSARIIAEIEQMSKELGDTSFKGANLENAVESCLEIAQNISTAWVSASVQNKQRLQSLIFPEGILYNKKKTRCEP